MQSRVQNSSDLVFKMPKFYFLIVFNLLKIDNRILFILYTYFTLKEKFTTDTKFHKMVHVIH